MVVAILRIRVGHRVRVVGVKVIAALRALKHWGRVTCGHPLLLRGQLLELRGAGTGRAGLQTSAAGPSLRTRNRL